MIQESLLDQQAINSNGNFAARNFWKNRLRQLEWTPYFDYNTNYGNISSGASSGRQVTIPVPAALLADLDQLAGSAMAKHIVLLTALEVLIRRNKTGADICIFTPVYNTVRTSGQQDRIIPVRLVGSADMDFTALLKTNRKRVLEDIRHGDFPLEKILNTSGETLRQLPAVGLHLAGLQSEAAFDALSPELLFSFDLATEAVLRITFDPCKFHPAYAGQIGNLYLQLLQQLLTERSRKIETFELVSEAERRQILEDLDQTDVSYPKEKDLVRLFTDQVSLTPQKVALQMGQTTLTYAELHRRSNQLAHLLRQQGVQRAEVVGLFVGRSIETVVAMLAVLKAGGAYLPIDIDYPEQRIAYILENSGTRILVSTKTFLRDLSFDGKVVLVEDAAGCEDTPLEPVNTPADLCYVLYTSGTTGNPKGVMVEHRNVVRLLFNDKPMYDFGPQDTWTMFHSHCFDVSVWEMYGALLFGGRLIIIPKHIAKDTDAYFQLLKEEKVTILNQTPTAFYNFIREGSFLMDPGLSLRYVIFGGEKLSPGRLTAWRKVYPQVRMINMYGITETTVHTTFKEITDYETRHDISNVGKPITTLSVYILNEQLQFTPKGFIGELYVGGDGVSRGYLGKEELTHQRFIPNPYKPGERLYRSGDLVRLLASNEIEYIGRIDHQVQIRGFRVELGEIENKLLAIEGVTGAIVLAKEQAEDLYLVAYYVAEQEIDQSYLRAQLSQYLPDYMMPAYFVRLQNLPLTHNGKVNKAALPDEQAILSGQSDAPGNALEETLRSIWATVLKKEPAGIGVNHKFFEVGGNSLTAIFLKNKIQQILGIELSLNDIFNFQKIKEQAVFISSLQKNTKLPVPKAAVQEFYALSAAQKRLYFLYHFNKEAIAYNMPWAVRLEGQVETDRLEAAFQGLIKRHDSLRTNFSMREGEPVQHIADYAPFELSHLSPERTTTTELIKNFRQPFDLSQAPLLRAGLVREASGNHILLVDMHHIISDGVSQSVLLGDLIALYEGKRLPAITCQYQDYVAWQTAPEGLERQARQQAYWMNEFSDIPPPLNLPTDFKRPIQQDFAGNTLHFHLGETITATLRAISQKEEASMFMVLLALYNVFLSRISQEEDIVVGNIVAGRQYPGLEQVVGMLANTLAIRNRPTGGLTFREFLQKVKQKVIQALDQQEYPYEELVKQLHIPRDSGRNPLFDVFFVYQHAESEPFSISGLDIHPMEAAYPLAKFDLTLIVNELEKGLGLSFEYATALFREDSIQRFFEIFRHIAKQVAAQPDISLQEIELLDELQRQQLRQAFDNSQLGLYRQNTIIDVFEQQASQSPGAIAIDWADTEVTYRELNQKANQLAHYLRENGITTDSVVGLYLERSPEMIISILAVLKAGGAYLPIDIHMPTKRAVMMLEDSGTKLMISHQGKAASLTTDLSTLDIEEFPWHQYPGENLSINRPPDSLSYIIYTSGTTGLPKGVMIKHENLTNLFLNEAFYFDFGPKDVWTLFHRYCFDFSVWEIFGALLFGGKLVIVSRQNSMDPEAFLEILKGKKVTVLNQTPTAFQNLMLKEEQDSKPQLACRYVIFGGEKLNPGALGNWVERYPHTRMINMFGITETTVHVTYRELLREDILSNRSVIGPPIPGLSVFVLDRHLKMVPPGCSGELYVGGEGVARGYINREELTASKFIENPFQTGTRLYRSGDLVRINRDLELDYIGRIDNQIQLKGFRIELGEIERTLSGYHFIKDAKVVPIKREDKQSLVAYYVAEKEVKTTHLRRKLAETLPLYMIPAHFICLDEMPLTANGKVNIDELPRPGIEVQSLSVPAEGPLEQALAEIWLTTLGISHIGATDNYFVAGGDSIMAIELVAKINRRLLCNIKIADLYQHQTIRELAGFITGTRNEREELYYSETRQALKEFHNNYLKTRRDDNIERVYPMTNIEKGMCYVQLQRPDDQLYYEQLLWNVYYDDFEPGRLHSALTLLAEQHTALRTGLDLAHFAHLIYKTVNIEIPFFDLSEMTEEEQVARVKADMKNSRERPAEWKVAPLWKMSIYKRAVANHVILFEIHHAISDGWSLATFVNDLNNIYFLLKEQPDYRPEPLRSGYEAFIIEEMVNDKRQENLQFWKRELEGYKKFAFNSKALIEEPQFRSLRIPFDHSLFDQLEKLADRRKCRIQHVFFAAYIHTLKLMSFENDVTAGLVTFNRAFGEDGAKVFGNFLNTIPVRLKFDRALSSLELLDLVDKKLLEIKPYDRSSLFSINQIMGSHDYGENPITDTLFNFTKFDVHYELSLSKVSSEGKESLAVKNFIRGHSLFDVNVNGVKGNQFIQYDYVTSFLNDEQFERFKTLFINTLRLFVSAPEAKLDLSVIHPEEHRLVTELFNRTGFPYDKTQTVVNLIEAQVCSTPNEIALICGDQKLSFAELNGKANVLAKKLRERGVRPDQVVAICTDRSPDMLIAILGVLKSGGCYLPLDPTYPRARLEYMLADTGAAILIRSAKLTKLDFSSHQLDELVLDHSSPECDTINPSRVNQANDLAYVIYTSGSTNQPKGVMIPHRAVVNFINAMCSRMNLGPESTIASVTTYSFDIFVTESLLPLSTGIKIVMADENAQQDTRLLADILIQNNVKVLQTTPSRYKMLLDSIEDFPVLKDQLSCAMVGGEALPRELLHLLQQHTRARIFNVYGPTETTVWSAAMDLTGEDRVTIGRPLANTSLYVLDDKMQVLPIGVAGELYIGGHGLARGYWNKPEITEKAFVSDPSDPQMRLYKTGDLVRLLDTGTLEYLGRIDHQVKIRGHRIELGEIEGLLLQQEGVREAAVVVAGEDENKRLVAFISADTLLGSVDHVLLNLKEKLPAYMLPAQILQLPKLPLTPNGKTDRKALLEKAASSPVSRVAYVAPQTDTQREIAAIWQKIFDREKIGIYDSFFEIGGHSLSAIQLIKTISDTFQIKMSLQELFQKPTIQLIAEYIDTCLWLHAEPKAVSGGSTKTII